MSTSRPCRVGPRRPPQVRAGCGRGRAARPDPPPALPSPPPPPTASPGRLRAGDCDSVATCQFPVASAQDLETGNWSLETADLFRIQLDDQLFLHGQVDLLARRKR